MNVGARIKSLRKYNNLTTRELAALADIPQPVISRACSADVELIQRICTALGITLSEFFADTQDREPLSPEVRRVCDKVAKLPTEKLKILKSVLDTWIEDD